MGAATVSVATTVSPGRSGRATTSRSEAGKRRNLKAPAPRPVARSPRRRR